MGVVTPAEAYLLAVKADETMVGDGDPVGVAPEIGERMRGVGERRFGVNHPIVVTQPSDETLEGVGVVDGSVF